MKISLPRPKTSKGRGNYNKRTGHRRRYGSPTWLHGRHPPSEQTPQSPVKEWADFTEVEKLIVLARAK